MKVIGQVIKLGDKQWIVHLLSDKDVGRIKVNQEAKKRFYCTDNHKTMGAALDEAKKAAKALKWNVLSHERVNE